MDTPGSAGATPQTRPRVAHNIKDATCNRAGMHRDIAHSVCALPSRASYALLHILLSTKTACKACGQTPSPSLYLHKQRYSVVNQEGGRARRSACSVAGRRRRRLQVHEAWQQPCMTHRCQRFSLHKAIMRYLHSRRALMQLILTHCHLTTSLSRPNTAKLPKQACNKNGGLFHSPLGVITGAAWSSGKGKT